MKNNPIKSIIIIVVIIAVFTLSYFVLDKLLNKEVEEDYLKNYGVNEFIPTYVSDEDMARIYFNEYIYKTHINIEDAYNLLDEEYRNKKFGNIENYRNYLYNSYSENYKFSKYYKREKGGYIIFGVYDSNNNLYVFKTKGVLQYKVYLDDYTVEI